MKQKEIIEEHAWYLQNLPGPLQAPRVDSDDAMAMLFGEDLFECDLKGGQVQIRGLGVFNLETALPIGPPQWCALISERTEGSFSLVLGYGSPFAEGSPLPRKDGVIIALPAAVDFGQDGDE